MKKAIAYARFSSNNQREESIDAQLRAINDYCEKNNIVLVESFTDEALTGKNDDRDNFQRMINGVICGHYDVDFVLVHKFNRFARNKFDSALHKKRLKDEGVKVISVSQNIDNTPEGEMLEGFLEVIDEYYSNNLALEVRKGLRENALKGKHTGGVAALGFSIDENGKYVPNENAKIVKRIFEEYAAEIPKTEICERLNAEGLRNQRGNTFNVRTIYDILRNEKYIGNYIYTLNNNEVIRLDGIITPIIDRELWYKVQTLCNQPVKARMRHQKERYLLTGKTFCKICGSQICGAGSKRMRNGDLYYYYKCVGKTKHRNGCKARSLNKKVFEKKVLNAIIETIFNEEQLREIARLTFAQFESMRTKPTVTTKALKQELSKIYTKKEKLTDLYLEGDLEKDILDVRNKELNQRKFDIEMELEKRKAVEQAEGLTEGDIYEYICAYIEELQTGIAADNTEFMHAVFTTFVDKVIVSNEEITVLVNADFSRFAAGDNGKFGGVIYRLSPVELKAAFPRKSGIWARNE